MSPQLHPARASAGSGTEPPCAVLGHAPLALVWLKASSLTAVQMVPSGSREIYEKCYPIKEGAGWLGAFTSVLFGEGIVSASGKCLT